MAKSQRNFTLDQIEDVVKDNMKEKGKIKFKFPYNSNREPDDLPLRLTITQLVYHGIVEGLQTNYAKTNRMQCSLGKRRSLEDMYWLAQRYTGNWDGTNKVTIKDLSEALQFLVSKNVISTNYCNIVLKEVHFPGPYGYSNSYKEFCNSDQVKAFLKEFDDYTGKRKTPVTTTKAVPHTVTLKLKGIRQL